MYERLVRHRPTIFCCVPTLFAAMLASPDRPASGDVPISRCTSAGEALPAEIGKRWTAHFGVEILDGLGSTEMLHIFLSNRPGEVRYGTSGVPVPGYELRIVGDDGQSVPTGEVGELQISGPSAAMGYWNNREKSHNTFQGPWTRSGDKYSIDADGRYVYADRSDDMLKVGGIYVSPVEVFSFSNALQLCRNAADAILSGDKRKAEALLAPLEEARSRMASVRTEVGVRLVRLSTQDEMLESRHATVSSLISRVEDADPSETAAELAEAERALQAVRESATKIISKSLFDFLR